MRFIFFQQLPVNDLLSPKRKGFPWPIVEKQHPLIAGNLGTSFLRGPPHGHEIRVPQRRVEGDRLCPTTTRLPGQLQL